MAKTIIIRDDDISFFTDPHMLDASYRRLWDAGVPISLATIPAQGGDTRVLHLDDHPYDPSIPPAYRGNSERYPITANLALCAYLNAKVEQGLAEITLHGYDHAYREFRSTHRADVLHRIHAGHKLLQQAIPAATIDTFIAPYDEISPLAFDLLLSEGYHISTHRKSLRATPHVDMPNYSQRTLASGLTLFASDDYCFHRHDPPEVCLANARHVLAENDFVIITNHYWTFFYDWQERGTALMAAWQTFVDDLLALPDARFTTFGDIAKLRLS